MKNKNPATMLLDVTKNVMGSITSHEKSQNVRRKNSKDCRENAPSAVQSILRTCLCAIRSISSFSFCNLASSSLLGSSSDKEMTLASTSATFSGRMKTLLRKMRITPASSKLLASCSASAFEVAVPICLQSSITSVKGKQSLPLLCKRCLNSSTLTNFNSLRTS